MIRGFFAYPVQLVVELSIGIQQLVIAAQRVGVFIFLGVGQCFARGADDGIEPVPVRRGAILCALLFQLGSLGNFFFDFGNKIVDARFRGGNI